MMKIVTLNLNYLGEKHGTWPDRKELIVNSLKKANPDIIAFQAVALDPDLAGGKDQASQICSELSGFRYHFFQFASIKVNGMQEGSAIISRIPLLEIDHRELSLRTQSEDPNLRVVLKSGFEVGDEVFYLFNGHFSWVPEQAAENIKETIPFLKTVSSKALFVGDLNNPPESTIFDPLREMGWKDCWEKLHSNEEGFTFESDRLFTRIDYAWANQGLIDKVKSIELLSEEKNNVRFSDHLGLAITISV